MVTVKIVVEKCTGCGACVDVCPEKVFELQEEGDKKVSRLLLRACVLHVERAKCGVPKERSISLGSRC